MANFGEADVFYLANALTPAQLRREAAHADFQAKVQEYIAGTDFDDGDNFPWREYAAACRQALAAVKTRKPAARPGRGPDAAEVKARVDIVAVAERYTTLKKTGRNLRGLCPLHMERHPSFVVYPDRQSWHCFGACGRGGDVIDLVMAAEKMDFKEALVCLA